MATLVTDFKLIATTAERTKHRKVDAEKRLSNKEWTDKWLVVIPLGGMKPMCLGHLYDDTVAVVKSSSYSKTLDLHYETTHMAQFDVSSRHVFPSGSAAR